jgi:hypothetical protein
LVKKPQLKKRTATFFRMHSNRFMRVPVREGGPPPSLPHPTPSGVTRARHDACVCVCVPCRGLACIACL